jgi:hypothetical protein
MRRVLFLGHNMTVQTFAERLNELNRYLLYFPEENPKQLDQDEIIEILDQAKAPEWHAAMVAANIDIVSMTYEESVAYFKRLENLEKIQRINGPTPLPVDNKKPVDSSTVGVAVGKKNPRKCGVTTVTKTTTIQPIAEQLQRPNSAKMVILRLRLFPEKSHWLFFSRKSIR